MNGIDNTIDDDKRLVGCGDGTGTSDSDCGGGTRLSGSRHNVGTGDSSLKRVIHRLCRSGLQVIHMHIGNRTGQVMFLDSTVTDHDDIVQHRSVRRESYSNIGLSVNFHIFSDVTHRRHFQHCVRSYRNGKLSVHICK